MSSNALSYDFAEKVIIAATAKDQAAAEEFGIDASKLSEPDKFLGIAFVLRRSDGAVRLHDVLRELPSACSSDSCPALRGRLAVNLIECWNRCLKARSDDGGVVRSLFSACRQT